MNVFEKKNIFRVLRFIKQFTKMYILSIFILTSFLIFSVVIKETFRIRCFYKITNPILHNFILISIIMSILGLFYKYRKKIVNKWRYRMSFSETDSSKKSDEQQFGDIDDLNIKHEKIKERKRNQNDMVSIKVTIIIILIALLMIPSTFIQDIVKEREGTKCQASKETAEKWGGSQDVNGPILYVPVEYEQIVEKKIQVKNPKKGESDYETVNDVEIYTKYLHVLPEELSIKGEIIPEIRYKSIYKILLYRSEVNISGNFLLTENKKYPSSGKIRWDKAFVAIGFSSMKSIKEVVDMSFGKEKLKLEQGLCKKDIYDYGLTSDVVIDHKPGMIIPFSYNLKLDGSSDLLFTPLGKETTVELNSTWADPNFKGNFLPNERTISDSGFVAKWNVMHLNREYPQNWIGEGFISDIDKSKFGVKLLIPVDDYRKISRAVKYLLLFVSLTFLMFFLAEIIIKKKIHPIQYILVGLSIVIFFVLLLSLSEHLQFFTSYYIAALSTIAMISLYSMSVIKSKKFAGIIALALSTLYIFLYILLQNQDYSLLFGSIGLFLALAITMYATKDTNWYNIKYSNDSSGEIENEKS